MMSFIRCAALALGLFLMWSAAARAQDYPSRQITLIVPWAAGGAVDTVARIVAPKLSDRLGKPVVVENRPGGGSTIGTYIADRAEPRGIEFLVYYAFVPMYDFAHLSVHFAGIKIEEDYKSWYDLMRRLDHMFSLHMDLSDLESRSEQLIASIDEQIDELEQTIPQLKVREYIRELTESFEERPFMPLGDVWERELGDLFRDLDE